jgi:hypothetical protein
MKRTRRIEITRYRRTVTVRNHDEPVVDDSEETAVIETLANEWHSAPEVDDHSSARLVTKAVPTDVKLTRTPFNFRRWLRQKFLLGARAPSPAMSAKREKS